MKQKRLVVLLVFPVLSAVWMSFNLVLAGEAGWNRESASYRVYLGVVPTSLIVKNPTLVDGDKTLHRDANADGLSQHVLVSVFRKPNNERVINATVIARAGIKKFFGGAKVEKPLEKMLTSGTVTYGNYFAMPEQGEYEIAVRIYEPNKDRNEIVTFVYKKL